MKIKYLLVLLTGILFSCTDQASKIISEAIDAHGGKAYQNIHVKFDFRGLHYDLENRQGVFSYQRIQKDSLNNEVKDLLTNDGFSRFVNGLQVSLPDSMAGKYERSVNSVAYFFFLPYGLNDEAVNKEFLGEVEIKDQSYSLLKVWFNEEGGGEDHQDVFMYWINKDSNLVDYLAYSYETDGGGVRFREAIKRHKLGEFTFQDYNNYGLEDAAVPLESLAIMFENGKLPLLSEIRNENISLLK